MFSHHSNIIKTTSFVVYIKKPILLFIFTFVLPYAIFAQEICDNGIDDDSDGLIDLNDSDCACEIIEPISLIPNPSFEDMNCCPSDRAQLECAVDWIQASEPTTDYIHLCNYMGGTDFPPPQPFPDGEGIMGFRDGRIRNGNFEPYWKEYAGACLLSPLLADTSYRFQFDLGFVTADKSPPINISFFGTTDCNFLPFGVGNEAFGCPSNSPDWVKLGDVNVSGGAGNVWVNSFIEIIPEDDIYAIAIGPDCEPLASENSVFYYFDNLLLADLASFGLQITASTHPCSNDYSLSVPDNPDFQYQWYLDGVALVDEVNANLSQSFGEGSYQVRIVDGSSCRVSATFEVQIPSFDLPINVRICEGDVYSFGDLDITEAGFYIDTFKSINNCDSIVALNLEVIGAQYDTVDFSILEGESLSIEGRNYSSAGEYPLTLSSSIGCDSLVLLKISNFSVYIPNVFSPNDDNVNDVFKVFAPNGKIASVDMKIFNRWGDFLFQGSEWNGAGYQPAVFVYVIEIQFDYGGFKRYSGSISLVK